MGKKYIVTKSQLRRIVQKSQVVVIKDWALNSAGNGFTKIVEVHGIKLECFVNKKTANWTIINPQTGAILKQGKSKDVESSKSIVNSKLISER